MSAARPPDTLGTSLSPRVPCLPPGPARLRRFLGRQAPSSPPGPQSFSVTTQTFRRAQPGIPGRSLKVGFSQVPGTMPVVLSGLQSEQRQPASYSAFNSF